MRGRFMNYISLFSSAGVGCYGFKMEGFDCIATSELIERRMNVQRANNKVRSDDGYIVGDITEHSNRIKLYSVVERYLKCERIDDVDVVIFTVPCQGMSVANHKKNKETIKQNSLVIDALDIVTQIRPKFFVAENVRAFMTTKCIDNGTEKKIEQAFQDWVGNEYNYEARVINFKDFGANSSRTRTLVIGVRKDLSSPHEPGAFFPGREAPKTLRAVIGGLPQLQDMGQIHENDIYHSFKKYRDDMRDWIRDVKQGQSAFDNNNPLLRPHTKSKTGEITPNVNKNGDKYKRQLWDEVAPCIHTRNDIMASQNTVHPLDDRVFSIRELMLMMNIPGSFKWSKQEMCYLNSMTEKQKESYLKEHEMNIRQSIGEAIPTVIIQKIANNIKKALVNERKTTTNNYKKLQCTA